MVCDKTCIHDGYSYLFLKKQVSFQEAKLGCEVAGGSLMRSFDRQSILKLETCCAFTKTAPSYWMGAERTSNCTNSSIPYRMVHNKACISELSTTVSSLAQNATCAGLVLIPAHTSDTHAGMREQPCNQTSSYACQFVAKTLLPTTTSTILSTLFTTTEDPMTTPIPTNATPPATTVVITSPPAVSTFETDAASSATPLSTRPVSSFEHLFYIGAAAVFSVLLITALVCWACYRRSKKEKRKGKRRTVSEESTATTARILPEQDFPEGQYCRYG